MRAINKFRLSQTAVQLGAVQPVQQWHTDERRRELVEIQLAEYELRQREEVERIAKAKGAK